MTLVLSLANSQFTIQLSDRRLTELLAPGQAGKPSVRTDEANKAGSLFIGDARLAYSFSGIAIQGSFDTRRWLLGAILEAAPPEFQIEFLVRRFCDIATVEFCRNPEILTLPRRDRRLSLMLTGYWNTTLGVLPAGWIITNFQRNFDLGSGSADQEDASEEFRVWRWHQAAPITGPFAHIERLGAWRGVTNFDMARLENLLRDGCPVDAIIGSALRVMHRASDADATVGTVGKQVSIVVVPRDPTDTVRFSSESSVVTNDVFLPDILVAVCPSMCKWLTLHLSKVASPSAPLPASVPRVHPKAPCPCRSGQTYGACHRRFRRDIKRSLQLGNTDLGFPGA